LGTFKNSGKPIAKNGIKKGRRVQQCLERGHCLVTHLNKDKTLREGIKEENLVKFRKKVFSSRGTNSLLWKKFHRKKITKGGDQKV